ncbi:MAG: stage II sporulation protein D [Faecousia sp.]
MDLEEYVFGVVLAEMPAEFEAEALKAQAVVARTFAWKAATTGGKHGDYTLCTNSACCQGYLSEGNYLSYYGTAEEVEKVRKAVDATAGIVITYGAELIEATYFSSSGGYTEDAAAVWGNDYPYLTAKESPEADLEGEESKAFSRAYLESTLHAQLGDDPEAWFHDWEFTNGGGVASVGIGNRTFSGTELRKALNLRSTLFSVSIENDVVFFHTKGYGHRVGMSQFGADAMALEGKTYEEILQYYYTGTELKKIIDLGEEN